MAQARQFAQHGDWGGSLGRSLGWSLGRSVGHAASTEGHPNAQGLSRKDGLGVCPCHGQCTQGQGLQATTAIEQGKAFSMDKSKNETKSTKVQTLLSCTKEERSFMVFAGSWARVCAAGVFVLSLIGCASWETPPAQPLSMPGQGPLLFSPKDKAQWESVALPGKLRTAFKLDKRDQRPALLADAQSSASMLRQRLNVPADRLGRLQFEWQVENLLEGANMAELNQGDSPVRLILAFEGDRSRFSAKNALLSDLTEALTGEPMPYATLMYVWSNHQAVESVIVHPRTDRVRKLVVESGPPRLQQWLKYQRHVRADYEKAFGEAPGALVAIAIMTDADNTRSKVRAWYGDIRLD